MIKTEKKSCKRNYKVHNQTDYSSSNYPSETNFFRDEEGEEEEFVRNTIHDAELNYEEKDFYKSSPVLDSQSTIFVQNLELNSLHSEYRKGKEEQFNDEEGINQNFIQKKKFHEKELNYIGQYSFPNEYKIVNDGFPERKASIKPGIIKIIDWMKS